MNKQNIISFNESKMKKIEKEHRKNLTKIALTSSSPTEYVFMASMYNLVEASHRIANDPEKREKCKRLYRQ